MTLLLITIQTKNSNMIGFTDAKRLVKNKADYHDALTRNGYFMPKLKGNFLTSEALIAIREKRMFCPRYDNMIYRPCPSPPTQQVVCEELKQVISNDLANQSPQWKPQFQELLKQLNRCAADRDWMLLILSTITQGKDCVHHSNVGTHPYFKKDYRAPPKENNHQQNQHFSVDNTDQFFSGLPESGSKGRSNDMLLT